VRVGTWNIESLMDKLQEVVDTMIRRRVNILSVQKMKWKGQKAKEVEDTDFKLWYTGNTSTKNDVGIVLDKSLKDRVVNIKRQGDMIILVKLLVGDLVFNVISAYVPQIGLNESVKMQFWKELDALVSSVPISEKLFIGGDLNRHIGSTRVGFDGVYGGFRYESRNQEGEGILNFALAYDLIVANTLFRKRVSHLVTFSSGQHCS
jgi:exonuclease III